MDARRASGVGEIVAEYNELRAEVQAEGDRYELALLGARGMWVALQAALKLTQAIVREEALPCTPEAVSEAREIAIAEAATRAFRGPTSSLERTSDKIEDGRALLQKLSTELVKWGCVTEKVALEGIEVVQPDLLFGLVENRIGGRLQREKKR